MMRWISITAMGSMPAKGSSSRMKRGCVARRGHFHAAAFATDRASAGEARRWSTRSSCSNEVSCSSMAARDSGRCSRRAAVPARRGRFPDGELAENRGFLRQVRQPQPRAAMDGHVRHRLAIDADVSRHRCAPGPRSCRTKWSCQRHWGRANPPLRLLHDQRNVLHHLAAAVGLGQVRDFQAAGGAPGAAACTERSLTGAATTQRIAGAQRWARGRGCRRRRTRGGLLWRQHRAHAATTSVAVSRRRPVCPSTVNTSVRLL